MNIKSTADQPGVSENSRHTTRPTNTSVKYCIKYESTMQVILGSEQYKVHTPFSVRGASAGVVATLNTSSSSAVGDLSLIRTSDNAFVAPVDGWYSFSAKTRQTNAGSAGGIVPYWKVNGDNGQGGTYANDDSYYQSNIKAIDFASTLYLKKGDYVQLSLYADGGYTSVTFSGDLDVALLTSSVDVNEINLIAADDVYSTDEQLVGSYLGKPMYKKTYPLSSTANAMDTVDVTSLNIEQMVKMEALCHITSGGSSYQLSIRSNTGTAGGSFVGYQSSNKVLYGVCDNSSNSKKWDSVTVWYTKTSDTAGSAPNKNSLLLTRPDLWTPGTEYDFGGGLYGQRFKGTTTGNSLSSGGLALVSGVAKTAQVKNKGGMVDMSGTAGTNWYDINGAWGQGAGTDYFLPLVTNTSQVLRFYCKNNQGITTGTIQYDIWITYTKS